MIGAFKWLLLGASVTALAQGQTAVSAPDEPVMLAAVSRDSGTLSGGFGPGRLLAPGKLKVEPLALVTPTGEWEGFDCGWDRRKGCRKFEKAYLSKPHIYTVVSADGWGATVNSAPTTLDECSVFTGSGTYSGAPINGTAIAASSTEMFTTGPSARRLASQEAAPIIKAISALVPAKLDSTKELRIYSFSLEGQDLLVVQRHYRDYATNPNFDQSLGLIFAIGTMTQGHFHLLHLKENTKDENELVLGTIHLKSGHDFLITTVNDPESQLFRIYGIKDGRLTLVYSGGGAAC